MNKTILFLILFLIPVAYAIPGIPCDFYGSLAINGEAAPIGTIVSAYLDGTKYAEFEVTTEGQYGLMSVVGDDLDTAEKDGAVDGEIISFKVNGIDSTQTATWQSGKSVKNDLSIMYNTVSSVNEGDTENNNDKIDVTKESVENRDDITEEDTLNKEEEIKTSMNQESETESGIIDNPKDETDSITKNTNKIIMISFIILIFIIGITIIFKKQEGVRQK